MSRNSNAKTSTAVTSRDYSKRQHRKHHQYNCSQIKPKSFFSPFLSPDDCTTCRFLKPWFDYRLPPLRNEYTLPNASLEDMDENQKIVFMVVSARYNIQARQAIRETWGQSRSNLFFIVGGIRFQQEQEQQQQQQLKEKEKQVLEEQLVYRDIIDSIHPDSYQALPYKNKFAFQYVTENMPYVDWIVKLDDDILAKVNVLEHWILRNNDKKNYDPTKPVVIGRIMVNTRVGHYGKWAEDPHYKNKTYPPWAQGGPGYIISRPIAEYITNKKDIYYYQGEDVSVGIWLDESQNSALLPPITWIDLLPIFLLGAKCTESDAILIGHRYTPEDIRQCFYCATLVSTSLLGGRDNTIDQYGNQIDDKTHLRNWDRLACNESFVKEQFQPCNIT